MTIQYLGQTARYSEATIAHDLIFLAGMVPENAHANAFEQTQDVLRQIDYWLAQAGSDKNHILEATIFLADMNDYDALNQAWDAWVETGHAPARACVQAKLAKEEWKVEIKISAVKKSTS